MELYWPKRLCIFCLEEGRPLSKSHLFPRLIGGFVWSWTECGKCNARLGEHEAALKCDPAIRIALEERLASELPGLSRSFSDGQPYFSRCEVGNLRARSRRGQVRLETTPLGDSRVHPRKRGRNEVRISLERAGWAGPALAEALERFDCAPEGELVALGEGISVRHGTTKGFSPTFDGEPVPAVLPAAIGFRFLALLLGSGVYQRGLDPVRDAIRGERALNGLVEVDTLIDRRKGYLPFHFVGLEETQPITLRLQMFGLLAWRVRFPGLRAAELERAGLELDLKNRALAVT